MDIGRVLVRNIKKYRKIRGISQEKLAGLCGASISFIRQIECGIKYPSLSFIGKLSSALSIPPAFLFADDEEEMLYKNLKQEQIKLNLIENLSESVKSAFSKL